MNKTKSIHISTQVEAVFEVWLGGWGLVAESIETKAISASNLKLKLTEAELGNNDGNSGQLSALLQRCTCQ